MKKEEVIVIRIDKTQKKKLFNLAKKSDIATSQYLRKLIKMAIEENKTF